MLDSGVPLTVRSCPALSRAPVNGASPREPTGVNPGRMPRFKLDPGRGVQLTEAVETLHLLVKQGSQVDSHQFYWVLKRCIEQKDLVLGKRVHALSVHSGLESDAFLANHIIRMYSAHGKLQEAMQVFTKVPAPDAFMWRSIISAYTEHGHGSQAINLYRQMRQSTVEPNNYVFVAVLKACASVGDIIFGEEVHADILGSGIEPDIFVGTCLVDVYAKCGSLDNARQVFESLPSKNTVTWTAMIAGYVKHGLGGEALALYASMQQDTMSPADRVTFVCLLQACASVGDLHQGKMLHKKIKERGLQAVVGSSVIDMYSKCGSLEDACNVFDGLPTRDVATWTAMIAGYAHHGRSQDALGLYARMLEEGITPANHVTFVCLLQACGSLGALHQGKQLHSQIQERGLHGDVVVGSCLVDMYAKCGSLRDARSVFESLPAKDVVAWTAMIAGYAKNGLGEEALSLYERMQGDSMTPANHVTFICLLQACTSAKALQQGKELHAQIEQQGLGEDIVVSSCLVDMYVKCGSLDDARRVFDRLPIRDVVTWTAMIGGYAQHQLGQEALTLYASMQCAGISPTEQTYVCLLKACTSIGAIERAKQFHAEIRQRGLEANVLVCNSLVDMYAKCGRLIEARQVLDRSVARDAVTWTALISGYAEHGNAKMARQCFDEMREQGVRPDDATFASLLVACSHEGMVNEGHQYFEMMVEHGIAPTAQHYNCMVDLLGRANRLDEAENVLQNMPFEKDAVGWTSLLSACRNHGDLERGKRCFSHLIELEPGNATAYVLLAKMYASAGRWMDADRTESLRKSAGAKKKPAKSCIEVQNKVHEFVVGEEKADISKKSRSITCRLKEEGGYVPQTELVLRVVPETVKEDALCGHAEKLAIAYGLLNTPDGTTLLVTKNLRMCNDCHSGTKTMSRIEKREILVRDSHRVHHFVNGFCSCWDRH